MDAFASALEHAAAIGRGDYSSEELTRLYLERIERFNPELNHYVLVTAELALEMAAAPPSGPLAGVPVSIKELVSLAGFPTTFGSRALAGFELPFDTYVVSRLKEAGCPILGKTNTSEFGTRPVTEYGLFGPARNPWNRGHTTGGSSGGAAGAVAAGLCGFAQGSDGGGSVRIPASCCGVVGLKPTRGVISSGPVFGEGWAGLSTDGVIARTVSDAGAALDAVAGHLLGDPYWADPDPASRKHPLRVAFTTEASFGVNPEVEAAIRLAAEAAAAAGHEVVEGGPDTSPFRELMLVIVAAGMASLPLPEGADLDPLNSLSIAAGNKLTAADYVRAVGAIREQSRRVVAFWDEHDVLITPTLTRVAPPIGTLGAVVETAHEEYLDWLSFTYPYNCTGQPAVSLPLAMSTSGLPIGVQLVGAPRGERTILGLASQLEAALPWRDRRPPGL
jgi:Asp-tRNA(Asn)/Glu-tRNA(Gln) amidotransferase A subunit family amidase